LLTPQLPLSYGKAAAIENVGRIYRDCHGRRNAMHVEAIQVVTTTAEKKDAETLAQAVLDNRLGACVQISGPIESRYWWNNRVELASEWVVTIKTRRDLYKPLERLLLELHPYDQPEILATAVVEVSSGYLKWMAEQLKDPGKGPA
jgi:periplasmic divalent cation tolerance protein